MDALTDSRTARPTTRRWGVRWRPAAPDALSLLCLPHAGGGAVAYRSWAAALGPEVEVVCVRLPGRESRLREDPYTAVDDLVPALVEGLEPWLHGRHAWFGHSMGALLAFEACRELRRRRMPSPERLFVSARQAPHLPSRETAVHDAPDTALLAHLDALNGTSGELLHSNRAVSVLMPMLRADFAVSETYHWAPEPPLDCPVSVYGGADDPVVNDEELQAWQRHTTADCTVRTFPGAHFYLHEDFAPVASAIGADLRSSRRPG